MMPAEIDHHFDFRTEAGERDPDSYSPTLRCYHQLLWSKPLPDRRMLAVTDNPQHGAPEDYYLYASLPDGTEQTWGSDSIIASHTKWSSMKPIMDQVDDAVKESFVADASTIGGYLLWPQNPVDRKHTINQARGVNSRIGDRFDLTLECVRRYYEDPSSESPLGEVFSRYPEFFELFGDFRGYVDFWLLQDLVTPDYDAVRFLLPFDEFETVVARDVEEWDRYRVASLAFCAARGERMVRWAGEGQSDSH